jgi:hypothetical protein
MKIFVVVAAMAMTAIGACGNADELKAANAKVDALTKENATLKSNLSEATASASKAASERDAFKAEIDKAAAAASAAAAAPPPAAAKGGAKPAAKPAAKKHK